MTRRYTNENVRWFGLSLYAMDCRHSRVVPIVASFGFGTTIRRMANKIVCYAQVAKMRVPIGQSVRDFDFRQERPLYAGECTEHKAILYAYKIALGLLRSVPWLLRNSAVRIKKQSYGLRKIALRGGNNRARTCDIYLVRVALSQLSYASTKEHVCIIEPNTGKVKHFRRTSCCEINDEI